MQYGGNSVMCAEVIGLFLDSLRPHSLMVVSTNHASREELWAAGGEYVSVWNESSRDVWTLETSWMKL